MATDLKGAAKGAFIGGAVSGVLGVATYFGAAAAGADFKVNDPDMMGFEVLPWFQPMVISLLAAGIALGVFAGLTKFAGDKAWSIFLGVAVLVFLGEFYAPFWAFEDMASIVALEIMHIPATVGILGGIHWFGRRS